MMFRSVVVGSYGFERVIEGRVVMVSEPGAEGTDSAADGDDCAGRLSGLLCSTIAADSGGACAQSKAKPAISPEISLSGKETVSDEVAFALLGCHLVEAAPSTAAIGNWPGSYLSGDETGWHCTMFPGKVVREPI